MLTLYIADVERDAGMKKLSREEAAKILEGMKVKIKIPKAAVTQWERNAALDVAIEVLNCSEIPNKSDTISRQAALDTIMGQPPEPHYPSWYAAQIEKLPAAQPEIIRCKDCDWWTKQKDSLQGRCELMQMYPTGGWYCGNARRRGGDSD